jgi:hypothetical protein
MTHRIALAALTALVALPGCANENDLANVEHVRTWANNASALAVWAHFNKPLAVAEGVETYADPACPVVTDDGTTLSIAGNGCTTATGLTHLGSATVVRNAAGGRTITLSGIGEQSGDETAARATGSVVIVAVSATTHTFDADFVNEGGITTTFDYAGRVDGTYTSAETLWNGSGTVSRDGLVAPNGTVEAATVDQRRNTSVCGGQSLTGSTSLMAGGQTAVITYDGATDCDEDEDAEWSLDGAPQGSISGIACAVRPGMRAPMPLFAALIPLLFVLRRARRRA